MHIASPFRALINAGAVVAPSVAPVTIPAWGPSAVDLFGINIPIASMLLSMLGLADGSRAYRPPATGPSPGGHYLTGVLALITFALVVERQPGPGLAIAWGIGIGGSGIVLYDIMRDRVMALFGRETKKSK